MNTLTKFVRLGKRSKIVHTLASYNKNFTSCGVYCAEAHDSEYEKLPAGFKVCGNCARAKS